MIFREEIPPSQVRLGLREAADDILMDERKIPNNIETININQGAQTLMIAAMK